MLRNRRPCRRGDRLAWMVAVLCASLVGAIGQAGVAAGGPVQELIQRAGNAEDDAVRLEMLKELAEKPDLAPSLAADVDKMVAFVERWIGEKSLWRWYDREVRRTVDYDFQIAEDSPLYPLTCFYRGRMLFWVTNEYGNIIGYHEPRRQFLDKAVEQFKIAGAAFPENRVIRMYLGEPIPAEKAYANDCGAPEWAALEREGLERLADVVEWWIDNRLRDSGEYGGAWDDDCEMWRSWVPVMIAFEHPKLTDAQAFFSDALMSQDYMKDGYTSHVYDVEHTAEPSTDTITPMIHLTPDDPVWKRRALRLAELMETLWTGTNRRGMLQFKSTYFSAQKVDPNPERACDTPYHVVAIQPALVLWQRTGDEKLGKLFSAWMDTWVDATARAERGKPAGIVPAAIRWPEGEIGGPGPDWWDPRHHNEPTLYVWPTSVGKLADVLLLTYHMTGDEKYLEPIRSMAAIRLAWLKNRPPKAPEPGTEAWCAAKLGFLAATLAKYKLLTGRSEFDEILAQDYRALAVSESRADRTALVASLRASAESLRVNFPGHTREVRFTDRVFAFPRMYGADMMFPEPVPANSKRFDAQLLYATATGDRGGFHVFPLGAVRWLTLPREIAALVTRSAKDRFTAELFHFGPQARPMGAELYLLAPGRYTFEITDGDSGDVITPPKQFSVTGPRTRIALELPPRRLCVLRIVPQESAEE